MKGFDQRWRERKVASEKVEGLAKQVEKLTEGSRMSEVLAVAVGAEEMLEEVKRVDMIDLRLRLIMLVRKKVADVLKERVTHFNGDLVKALMSEIIRGDELALGAPKLDEPTRHANKVIRLKILVKILKNFGLEEISEEQLSFFVNFVDVYLEV